MMMTRWLSDAHPESEITSEITAEISGVATTVFAARGERRREAARGGERRREAEGMRGRADVLCVDAAATGKERQSQQGWGGRSRRGGARSNSSCDMCHSTNAVVFVRLEMS